MADKSSNPTSDIFFISQYNFIRNEKVTTVA